MKNKQPIECICEKVHCRRVICHYSWCPVFIENEKKEKKEKAKRFFKRLGFNIK